MYYDRYITKREGVQYRMKVLHMNLKNTYDICFPSLLKKSLSFFLVGFSFSISISINATIANDSTLSTDMAAMVSLLLHNMTVQNQIRVILHYLENHENDSGKSRWCFIKLIT